MALFLHQDGDCGSPPPVDPGWPTLRSPRSVAGFEREVCAEAPAAPTGGGSPPLPSVAVTAVEPSDRFGGLLDEQSSTVNLGFHYSAQYSLKSAASGAAAGYVARTGPQIGGFPLQQNRLTSQ